MTRRRSPRPNHLRRFGPALAGYVYVAVAYWSPFVLAGLLFVPILVFFGLVTREHQ